MEKEQIFFHEMAPIVLDAAKGNFKKTATLTHKSPDANIINFATETDILIENTIVTAIKYHFPDDLILAEEGYSGEKVPKSGRIWIIDPICGTENFARHVPVFSTNIALVIDNTLSAACVVDHAQGEYIWSTGDGKIYINQNLQSTDKKIPTRMIDIDLSPVARLDKEKRMAYSRFVEKVVNETNFVALSYASSLQFAYVALGRLDAYVNPISHTWDVAAANFLIQQSGGIVTDLSGNPWSWDSVNAIGARDKEIHEKLLELLRP